MKFLHEYRKVILAFIGGIAGIVTYIFGGDSGLNYSLLVVIVFLSVGVIGYAIEAFKSFSTTAELPPPKGFWSFLFNKLPTSQGKHYSSPATKVLLINYSKNEYAELAKKIEEEFKNLSTVRIEQFVCEDTKEKQDDQRKELEILLRGCEAILIFRSIELEEIDWIYKKVDLWTEKNSHIPSLTINLITEDEKKEFLISGKELNEIPEKYNSISLKNSKTVPWRLLSRANERALAWKKQANTNRKYSFGCLTFFTILGIIGGSIVYFLHSEVNQKYDDYVIESNQRNTKQYNSTHEIIASIFTKPLSDSENIQKCFSDYATLATDYYTNLLEIDNIRDYVSISFWRKRKVKIDNNVEDIVYQFGWSDPEPNDNYYAFPYDNSSIIGCAFNYENNYVLWDSKLPDKEKAVWSITEADKDTKVGEWNATNIRIQINSDCCKYLPQKHSKHRAILCLSYINRNKENERQACGVCIDSKTDDTSFLRHEKSLEFIKQLATEFSKMDDKYFEPKNIKERIKRQPTMHSCQ